MGLDGVEIIMATEERFGIEIPDSVAATLCTPGDLVEYVARRVDVAVETNGCHSQRLFYRLRRGFRLQVPALVDRFHPALPLADVLHKDQWPRVWKAIRDTVGEPDWPTDIPWQGLLRGGPKTVEELIWTITRALPRPLKGEDRRWTTTEVEVEVRSIISEISGIGPFRLRHRFVDDLGID